MVPGSVGPVGLVLVALGVLTVEAAIIREGFVMILIIETCKLILLF